jgi:hypothetical protein
MTIDEAIELLELYNEWRRGAETPQPNPADVGIAIEMVIRELKGYILYHSLQA